jgi:hypothetical protein
MFLSIITLFSLLRCSRELISVKLFEVKSILEEEEIGVGFEMITIEEGKKGNSVGGDEKKMHRERSPVLLTL